MGGCGVRMYEVGYKGSAPARACVARLSRVLTWVCTTSSSESRLCEPWPSPPGTHTHTRALTHTHARTHTQTQTYTHAHTHLCRNAMRAVLNGAPSLMAPLPPLTWPLGEMPPPRQPPDWVQVSALVTCCVGGVQDAGCMWEV